MIVQLNKVYCYAAEPLVLEVEEGLAQEIIIVVHAVKKGGPSL